MFNRSSFFIKNVFGMKKTFILFSLFFLIVSVDLETTVKALVVVDGKPTQILEETFGQNEGFTWNKQ